MGALTHDTLSLLSLTLMGFLSGIDTGKVIDDLYLLTSSYALTFMFGTTLVPMSGHYSGNSSLMATLHSSNLYWNTSVSHTYSTCQLDKHA